METGWISDFYDGSITACPRRERPQVHSFFYRTGADHSDSIACDKFFTSDDLFVQFQDQYDAMETQVEEMLKNTSGLESVMKSQDNRNAEDELSENVEGGEPGGIQVEEIRIGHGSENPKGV